VPIGAKTDPAAEHKLPTVREPKQSESKEPEIGVDPNDVFPTVHVLALRGSLKQLPGDSEQEFEAAGLVRSTPDGFTLTEAGHRHHRALFEQERAALDIGLLGIVFEPFPTVARRLKTLESRWYPTDGAARRKLVRELGLIIDDMEPILHRSGAIAPRFGTYVARLRDAELRLTHGDLEYAFDHGVESIHTIVRELYEDYLQTLGRGYEQDES
jgi:hypothetical protein